MVPLQVVCVFYCLASVAVLVGSPLAVLVGLLPSCSASSPQLQCWFAPQGDQFTAVASPLTSSTSCSNAKKNKKQLITENPWRQKYITFNRRKYGDVSEQIHIVSSHRQLGDRQKVSFHGKFPDYYTRSHHQHYSHIIPPAFTWEKAKLKKEKINGHKFLFVCDQQKYC